MPRMAKWTLVVLGLVGAVALFPALMVFLPLAVLAGIVAGGAALHQRLAGPAATPGVSALSFGLTANIIAVALTMLTFLPFPPGSSGRPMALTLFYFLYTVTMTPIGLWKSVAAWRHREKPLAVSAATLTLGLLPIEMLTFLALASTKAFELEP